MKGFINFLLILTLILLANTAIIQAQQSQDNQNQIQRRKQDVNQILTNIGDNRSIEDIQKQKVSDKVLDSFNNKNKTYEVDSLPKPELQQIVDFGIQENEEQGVEQYNQQEQENAQNQENSLNQIEQQDYQIDQGDKLEVQNQQSDSDGDGTQENNDKLQEDKNSNDNQTNQQAISGENNGNQDQDQGQNDSSDEQQQQQQQENSVRRQGRNLIINVSDVQSLKKSFQRYKQEYLKDYEDDQQIIFRFVVYTNSNNNIRKHNSNKNKTYRIHLNQFADKTLRQFQSTHLMKNIGSSPPVKGIQLIVPDKIDTIPIDWRQRRATGKIKQQGQCGACWAFTITSVIESHLFIKRRQPLSKQLSQQQLVDCCSEAGFRCYGCDGAWPGTALKYAAFEGFALAKDYPYVGKDQKCTLGIPTTLFLNSKNPFTQIKGTNQLLFALLSGPVAVVVDSSLWEPLYDEGIFDQCTRPFDYNHAVVVVGVQDDGVWIVRNSWGRYWGEDGHIRLPAGNSCGITDWGIVPILDE